MTKQCRDCQQIKPVADFYCQKCSRDGLAVNCKICFLAAIRAYRAENREKVLARLRYRYKNDPVARARMVAGKRKWVVENRAKSKAQNKIRRMIYEGQLNKPASCQCCGATAAKIDGHHLDYTRPLSIRWLCHNCHVPADTIRRAMELQ